MVSRPVEIPLGARFRDSSIVKFRSGNNLLRHFVDHVDGAEGTFVDILKGNALFQAGVNATAAADAAPLARKQELKPKEDPKASTSGSQKSNKPGSIDPFLSMVRDLNK